MPNRLLALCLPLLLLSWAPHSAVAQNASTLRRGDDVRVHAPGLRNGRIRGTVILYEGSALEVRERSSGSILSIPVSGIRELARNEGRDLSRSAWRSARIGAFVGGSAGLVTGPLIATSYSPDHFGEIMIATGAVGLLAGSGLGALIGTLFARDHWQHFRMPIVPIATNAGFGLHLSAPAP